MQMKEGCSVSGEQNPGGSKAGPDGISGEVTDAESAATSGAAAAVTRDGHRGQSGEKQIACLGTVSNAAPGDGSGIQPNEVKYGTRLDDKMSDNGDGERGGEVPRGTAVVAEAKADEAKADEAKAAAAKAAAAAGTSPQKQQQPAGDDKKMLKRRISQIIWRKKKQLVQSLQQGGCSQKERGDMLYELGSVIGKRAGEKVSSRCHQRHKGGGPCWKDGMEELSQKTYLLLGNVFKEDELAFMGDEINEKISSSGALVQDKLFERRVSRDVLANESEDVGGRVAIDGCQMLSGFIDGVKSTIDGWEDKIYTDAARLATEPNSKNKGQAELHTDTNPEYIKSMNQGDPGWPVALYFPLEWEPSKLFSHRPPGKRGPDTTAKDMVVPAGSLLIFVPTNFRHSPSMWSNNKMPPKRLYVKLYGCKEST